MITQYIVGTKPKIQVEAVVTRACPNCGHSGWENDKYYEDFCPSCGTERPKAEPRGVIYDNDPWWLLKRRIRRFFGKD